LLLLYQTQKLLKRLMPNNRRTFECTDREQHGWLRLKYQRLFKGLKKIHIGEDVWLIGKDKKLKDGRLHQVIYGPENKEYHLYDEDVKYVNTIDADKHVYNDGALVNRHGNTSYNEKVKIYILTHILDQKENWCFDLNNKPNIGKLKVIYHNGTVKNIEFDGTFKPEELISKTYNNSVKPVAYRIK
jgi:hypothetical protein